MTLNRSEIARALAKAIAYKSCGKQAEAARWAPRQGYRGWICTLCGAKAVRDALFARFGARGDCLAETENDLQVRLESAGVAA